MSVIATQGFWSRLFTPRESVQMETLHVQDVWRQGYTGKGVGIAIIDTGITPHPDLQGRIADFEDFVNQQPSMYDDHGHGTAVAVAAAGNGVASSGNFYGPAPGATVIGLKGCDKTGHAYSANIVQGLEWAIANRQRYNIRVVNMSFSLDDPNLEDRTPVLQALKKAADSGIIPVAAAGNDGPHSIETLASYPYVVTVAAFDPQGTVQADDDTMARFSSGGPGENGEEKPDVSAPGVDIVTGSLEGGYRIVSGTSFASPITAGVIATWLEANPNLNVLDVQHILHATSHPIAGVSTDSQGAGEIDPMAGLKMALAMKPAQSAT